MKYPPSSFIVFLSALFFTSALLYFFNNDFWQDEIYTITHFIYVPFKTVVTDYHTTNNHILFFFRVALSSYFTTHSCSGQFLYLSHFLVPSCFTGLLYDIMEKGLH